MNHVFAKLPPIGAWRLLGVYEGSEVVRFAVGEGTILLDGTTVGVEEGAPWSIHYVIELDDNWYVKRAAVTDYAGTQLEIRVEGGSWIVNGKHHAELGGCLDLDFEASVVTNTLPVHRLALQVGEQGKSAAAYIRTVGLAVERLDQTYRRLPDAEDQILLDYEAPRFGYRDTLRFAPDGLAIDYPGIGVRVPVKK